MNTKILAVYAVFLVIMSFVSLILYKTDKVKAKKGKWRTKESVLLGFGFFGGAIGALSGMKLFRHKTKHWYFWTVNIIGLIWQTGLLVWLILRVIS
ncbi:MAG: DUF1294 domain-containing protein [Ruminococcus sp.]|nr:DUF1294 domain-containing protein [Ruminococcus sp.]